MNKDGSKRLQRYYSKKGGRWTVNEVKAKKKYPYISDLLRQILMKRLADEIGMNRNLM